MQRSQPGPLPPDPQRPMLLRPGEQVDVALVAYAPQMRAAVTGVIVGTDDMGLLVESDGGRAVFVPWHSVLMVTKVEAAKRRA